MKEYEIKKFDVPVNKDIKDVEKYDVTRFEYGDFDNWVDAIIIDIRCQTTQYGTNRDGTPHMVDEMVIVFDYEYGNDGKHTEAYSNIPRDNKIEIVGHAEPIVKEKVAEVQAEPEK